jgi:hypothetical protein
MQEVEARLKKMEDEMRERISKEMKEQFAMEKNTKHSVAATASEAEAQFLIKFKIYLCVDICILNLYTYPSLPIFIYTESGKWAVHSCCSFPASGACASQY